MIVYYAGAENKIHRRILIENKIKSILFSFFHGRKSKGMFEEMQTHFDNIFIDSGGFTARKTGVAISIEEYGQYLIGVLAQKRDDVNVVYANLDTADVKETLQNQAYLERLGLKPLPVYHGSDYMQGNLELLDEYVKKYDYIAAGGMAKVKTGKKEVMAFLDALFLKAKDKVKVHGFGIMRPDFMSRYPFYSTDATSWLAGARYGVVAKWYNGGLRNNRDLAKLPNNYKTTVYLKNIILMHRYIDKLWQTRKSS